MRGHQFVLPSSSLTRLSRCEADVQKTLETLTFEQLVTDQSGVHASRALVNVVINQQIGQQISVSLAFVPLIVLSLYPAQLG